MPSLQSFISRRHLLRGHLVSGRNPIHPPWANEESLFTDLCTRCNECIAQCETGILFKGDAGFPEVDFSRGECTFCQACVSHCQANALSLSNEHPWDLIAVITEGCLTENGVVCMTCRDQCPEQAVKMQPRLGAPALPVIDNNRCNGCGACFAPCPANAIQIQAEARP